MDKPDTFDIHIEGTILLAKKNQNPDWAIFTQRNEISLYLVTKRRGFSTIDFMNFVYKLAFCAEK